MFLIHEWDIRCDKPLQKINIIWYIDFKDKIYLCHDVWQESLSPAHLAIYESKSKKVWISVIPRIFYLWLTYDTGKKSRTVRLLAECTAWMDVINISLCSSNISTKVLENIFSFISLQNKRLLFTEFDISPIIRKYKETVYYRYYCMM